MSFFDRFRPILVSHRYNKNVEHVLQEVIQAENVDKWVTDRSYTSCKIGDKEYVWWNRNRMYGFASQGVVRIKGKLVFRWTEARPKRKTLWRLLDKEFYLGGGR